MDWRHMKELQAAGEEIYSGLENLCVWNKSNAGMGSLYRSKHELIFVFKVGTAAHINNVALGRHGRHRTNVWDYVSQNALNGTAKSKLAVHPTVKPVAMIADAIRDCSNRRVVAKPNSNSNCNYREQDAARDKEGVSRAFRQHFSRACLVT